MAEAFDGLDDADGVDPWDPAMLLAWSEAQPRDIQYAARFVLSLARPQDRFRGPRRDAGVGRPGSACLHIVGAQALVGFGDRLRSSNAVHGECPRRARATAQSLHLARHEILLATFAAGFGLSGDDLLIDSFA